jgi:hypothetical protein
MGKSCLFPSGIFIFLLSTTLFYLANAGFGVYWETAEAYGYVYVNTFFMETIMDTLIGDMSLNYIGTFVAWIILILSHGNSISMVFLYRSPLRVVERVVWIILFVSAVDYISAIDAVLEGNEIFHIGFYSYIGLKVAFLQFGYWSDLQVLSRSDAPDKLWHSVHAQYTLLLIVTIMHWIFSVGLEISNYKALLISQTIFVICFPIPLIYYFRTKKNSKNNIEKKL